MHKYSRFFNEIFTSSLIIDDSAFMLYMPFIRAFKEGRLLDLPQRQSLKMGIFDLMGMPMMDDRELEKENNVAVIPIKGVLTRSGSWWDAGTEEIASLIDQANNDDSIAAIVFDTNCYGGAVDGLAPIEAACSKKKKPIIAAVNSVSYSLGYFVNILADKIYAVNKMSKVGSIGVMMEYYDNEGYYKELGIKKVSVYPPESNWKNRPQREAMEGNTDLIIKEDLSPWAQYFQESVRANRPNLNETVEGTLQGRTFFANYTPENAIMNGLVDGVMPMDEIIQYAYDLSQTRKAKSIFTN